MMDDDWSQHMRSYLVNLILKCVGDVPIPTRKKEMADSCSVLIAKSWFWHVADGHRRVSTWKMGVPTYIAWVDGWNSKWRVHGGVF